MVGFIFLIRGVVIKISNKLRDVLNTEIIITSCKKINGSQKRWCPRNNLNTYFLLTSINWLGQVVASD